MGLRDMFESERGPKLIVVAGLFLIAIAFAVWMVAGSTGESHSEKAGKELYYTTDDGKTWFADSADKTPPFLIDGKAAVQVLLFTDDDGKTKFAGYLQRYDAATKKRFDANPKISHPPFVGTEVKKIGPGGAWISRNSRAGVELTNVVSPKGNKDVTPVLP